MRSPSASADDREALRLLDQMEVEAGHDSRDFGMPSVEEPPTLPDNGVPHSELTNSLLKETPRHFIESYRDFANRVSKLPEPKALVSELVYEDCSILIHGQPRAMKSLSQMELTLAMSIGHPPFGLERFDVPEPVPVCYVMEEDPERRMYQRFEWLLNGRQEDRPENLHLTVRQAIDLDDEEWQAALIEAGKKYSFKYTVLDPLRSLTAGADKGPSDLKPFATFVRRYIKETGSAVGIVHHDTKPPIGKEDIRKRPQKASGGGIYSISDSPIHVEEIDQTRSLLAPCGYKFTDDPKPFVVTFEPEGEPVHSVQLVGQNTEESKAKNLALRERILSFLAKRPGATSTPSPAASGRGKNSLRRCWRH